MTVAALFCRKDTVYRQLGCDVYDIERDARNFELDKPVIAHPPCRAWCNLAHFAKPRPDERDLAWWAMHVVRYCGGVLEHPITSKLWREANCLTPGVRDRFGGVLVTVHQSWWGHRAQKATGFYIVGPVPEMPAEVPTPTRQVGGRAKRGQLQNMGKAEREATPPALASWLVDLAARCAQ